MKSLEESILEKLVVFSRVYDAKLRTDEELAELVDIWLSILDDEYPSVELFTAACRRVLRTRKDYFPTPACVIEAITAIRAAGAPRLVPREHLPPSLPEPARNPITAEERDAIRAQMRRKGSKLMDAVLEEQPDDAGRVTTRRGMRPVGASGSTETHHEGVPS